MIDDEIDDKIKFLIGENYDYKYLNNKFKKYYSAIQEMLKLNDFNIVDKIKIAPSVHHGLIQHYYNEKSLLEKLKVKKTDIQNNLINTYGNNKVKFQSLKVLEENKEYTDITKLIKEQEDVVKYLSDCLNIFKTFSFDIKNLSELMKIS